MFSFKKNIKFDKYNLSFYINKLSIKKLIFILTNT